MLNQQIIVTSQSLPPDITLSKGDEDLYQNSFLKKPKNFGKSRAEFITARKKATQSKGDRFSVVASPTGVIVMKPTTRDEVKALFEAVPPNDFP